MTTSCDRELVLDLETYSSADLSKTGVYKYAEAPDFEILLMSYAFDDDPVEVWDFVKDGTPEWLASTLLDPSVLKIAHNAAFERACLNAALGIYTPPEQWADTMHLAAMNGLPASLEGAGAALQLTEQKLDTGKSLIPYFCKPCKATKVNGGRTRNLPEHAPDKWELFVTYCQRDTETERTIWRRLKRFPVTDTERRVEALDFRINEAGVLIDMELAESAMAVDEVIKTEGIAEMQRLTGLANPMSITQLKGWLNAAGFDIQTVDKASVKDLLTHDLDATTRRVLQLRLQLGKASTSKYLAMHDAACQDDRVRGTLQYYGAGRTGRWAGRIIQPQNLPQNHLADIGMVREIVRQRDIDSLRMLYDSVPDTLSQLIRTAIIAGPGKTFLVADYHAIEAVCIAYLAGEQWRLDVFGGDGKIYEASYAMAFGVPKESVVKGSPERQKGKIMELALGYGGGPNALLAFGADKLGLDAGQLQELVDNWRAASPMITRMWRQVEKAAKLAIENPGRTYKVARKSYDPLRAAANEEMTGGSNYSHYFNDGIVCAYRRDKDALRMTLPSGRILSYWEAQLDDGAIEFMAQNQTTRKWVKTNTWGGRLVENIVQAYARDVLAEAMLRLYDAGYKIVFSVHDEVIVEAPEDGQVEDIMRIMGLARDWAPGLEKYLHADGYSTKYYRKD